MYKIAILTNNIKEDQHSAELFEKVSTRAQAYVLHPRDLELQVLRNTPIIKSKGVSLYDLDAIIVRRLSQVDDTDLQFDLLCHLERSGVMLFNSTHSLQITESKALTYLLLSSYGLPTIESLVTQDFFKAQEFIFQTGDAIIKPVYGQLGDNVYRTGELTDYREQLKKILNSTGSVFIQRYINSNGIDKRIFVIGDHVCAAIERRSKDGWKSNIHTGAKAKKIILNDNIRNLALKSCQLAGLDYCGVDIISDNENDYVLELNGSPAWSGIKEATNKDIAEEIISNIIKRLTDYRKSVQYISS